VQAHIPSKRYTNYPEKVVQLRTSNDRALNVEARPRPGFFIVSLIPRRTANIKMPVVDIPAEAFYGVSSPFWSRL
jgi:hypothetical protein